MTKGTVLSIYQPGDRVHPIGHLAVTTVFRERSRGRVEGSNPIHAGDVVVIPPRLAVSALRQQMLALAAAGDSKNARAAGERAVALFDEAGAGVEDRRTVLEIVGALERREGNAAQASAHLRAAVALLDASPVAAKEERVDTLNELGVSLLDLDRREEAIAVLAQARQSASGAALARVENNLGAAAMLQGDRAASTRHYQAALRAAAGLPRGGDERRAIENNLSDLSGAR